MSKLTKAQKEFFTKFTKTAIQNILLTQVKPEYAAAVRDASTAALAEADISSLRDAVAREFLARTDFKTVVRVDKFLSSEDYAHVNRVASEVLESVEGELGAMLHAVADTISETVVAE